MAQRALVTGAGGFVGANLCRRLVRDGLEVHAVVRPGADQWRLVDLDDALTVHDVDLTDSRAVAAVLDESSPQWVFHLAAHGAYSWQSDVATIFATNTIATALLIEAASRHHVEAFVHAGSSSEYGFKAHPPSEAEIIDPNSPYAVSKAAATHYVTYVARRDRLHAATLRLYSVFGPWEEPNRLMPALAVAGLAGSLPPLVDPRTARDYVYIADVCDAFVRAASEPALDPGIVVNVGTGTQTSLEQLVELTRERFGLTVEPRWASMPARSWDTSVWVSDSTRIREVLGWQPQWSLAAGFDALVAWLREEPVLLDRYERAIAAARRP